MVSPAQDMQELIDAGFGARIGRGQQAGLRWRRKSGIHAKAVFAGYFSELSCFRGLQLCARN